MKTGAGIMAMFLLPAVWLAEAQLVPATAVPFLAPPIVLHELLPWRDGGSLGFIIGDGKGKTFSFTLDGRAGSSTRGHFFLGVTHRDQPGGLQLEIGGEQEQVLLKYLTEWLDSNFNRDELRSVVTTKNPRDWTTQQFDARHVLDLIEGRTAWVQWYRGSQPGGTPDAAAPRR